jgi:hypothetical protein
VFISTSSVRMSKLSRTRRVYELTEIKTEKFYGPGPCSRRLPPPENTVVL